jgi:CHAD domain-containing protein
MGHATTRLRAPLSEAIASQTAMLVASLARARRGDARGVHHARTTSRRLRELLPVADVAAPRAGALRARRDLRRLTRALGGIREIDVAMAELGDAASRASWDRLAVRTIEQRLAAERDQNFREAARRLDVVETARLRARLEAIAAVVSGDPTPRVAERALARRLRRRASRVLTAVEAAGTLYAPEQLHTVRIAVKKLRYSLEIARDAAALPVDALVTALKRQQDVLGRLHDLEVLAARVRAAAAGAGRRTAVKSEEIALALDRECREQHATFLSRRDTLTALACRASDEVAPVLLGRGLPMIRIGADRVRPRDGRWRTVREVGRHARRTDVR